MATETGVYEAEHTSDHLYERQRGRFTKPRASSLPLLGISRGGTGRRDWMLRVDSGHQASTAATAIPWAAVR
jgi:hypothetical protein